MTPEQFRMAKAALGISNPQLAEMTGLHRNTLNKLDRMAGKASTTRLVRMTLEAEGVQFIDSGQLAAGPGVALPDKTAPVPAAQAGGEGSGREKGKGGE